MSTPVPIQLRTARGFEHVTGYRHGALDVVRNPHGERWYVALHQTGMLVTPAFPSKSCAEQFVRVTSVLPWSELGRDGITSGAFERLFARHVELGVQLVMQWWVNGVDPLPRWRMNTNNAKRGDLFRYLKAAIEAESKPTPSVLLP